MNRSLDPSLAALVLDALPLLTLVVDRDLRVLHANATAQTLLGAKPGAALGEALGCVETKAGECGQGARCAGCAFRGAAERALAGEAGRARGFVLRTDASGEPADLHLLAVAAPVARAGEPLAVLGLTDVDRILADPGVVKVCAGCGRVEDDGEWHELHRYMEDRIGLEVGGDLCAGCGAKAGRR